MDAFPISHLRPGDHLRSGGIAKEPLPTAAATTLPSGALPANSSPLEQQRRKFLPAVPEVLLSGEFEIVKGETTTALGQDEAIAQRFPKIYGQPFVDVVPAKKAATPHTAPAALVRQPSKHHALRIGCVLSGGQAAGGHSCICGLFDYLKAHAPGSALLGFIGGPAGVMRNAHKILRQEMIDHYRSSGGFTMLASGRDKIETPEQFEKAVATAQREKLDGLVVIGGDDSNTNAALLAEHFLSAGLKTRVIGLPKTIDGDLKNEHIGTSFGFDTAAKLYAPPRPTSTATATASSSTATATAPATSSPTATATTIISFSTTTMACSRTGTPSWWGTSWSTASRRASTTTSSG